MPAMFSGGLNAWMSNIRGRTVTKRVREGVLKREPLPYGVWYDIFEAETLVGTF